MAARLGERPFHVLAVSTRAELEREARRDPLAHGTLVALGAAALLALVLAAVGLALAVWSDLRDDRSELYELEAQGATPSLLRRVVRSRALALAVAGLVAGALTGVLLVTFVTRLVSVTARAGFADPPLAATVDPLVVVAGVVAYALLAFALVGAATRRAFAEPRGPSTRGSDRGRDRRRPRPVRRLPVPGGRRGRAAGLTLSVDEREICVVLGPSGSGKTTLMRVLAGLERPSAGSVVVAGLDLGRASPRQLARHRRDVLGYADQHYWKALAGELTAEELVSVPLGLSSVDQRERRARARELLERVGLLDRANGPPERALGRRATAHRSLRGTRASSAPAHRRRADGRARRGDRGGGARPPARARPRARVGRGDREPRPRFYRDRRPRREHPRRPRERRARRRGRDRRRWYGRLAARARGDAARGGDRGAGAARLD